MSLCQFEEHDELSMSIHHLADPPFDIQEEPPWRKSLRRCALLKNYELQWVTEQIDSTTIV